jgi:hypothetical protein
MITLPLVPLIAHLLITHLLTWACSAAARRTCSSSTRACTARCALSRLTRSLCWGMPSEERGSLDWASRGRPRTLALLPLTRWRRHPSLRSLAATDRCRTVADIGACIGVRGLSEGDGETEGPVVARGPGLGRRVWWIGVGFRRGRMTERTCGVGIIVVCVGGRQLISSNKGGLCSN